MDTILLFQQAFNDSCSKRLEDKNFVTTLFKHIHEMKREFGKGYALINVGDFSPNNGDFISPHIHWVDESTTHELIEDKQVATNILNQVNSKSCPHNHEILIFIGTMDNGDFIKEGRYSIVFMRFDVSDPYRTKPSSITAKQIEKRLRRMTQGKIRLLILDTSNPDFMGDNLAKWLREIKKLGKYEDQHFSVIIDSNDEFPAKIPPDLQDDCLTIRIDN